MPILGSAPWRERGTEARATEKQTRESAQTTAFQSIYWKTRLGEWPHYRSCDAISCTKLHCQQRSAPPRYCSFVATPLDGSKFTTARARAQGPAGPSVLAHRNQAAESTTGLTASWAQHGKAEELGGSRENLKYQPLHIERSTVGPARPRSTAADNTSQTPVRISSNLTSRNGRKRS